jgi:predicted histone-like DNA-binding protein
MPLKYKVVSSKNSIGGEASPKLYYPRLVGRSQIKTRDLAKQLSGRTSFSQADVIGLLAGLAEIVPQLLADGYSVSFEGLGIFSLQARVSGNPDPEKVSVKNIQSFNIAFRADKEAKKALRGVKAVKQTGEKM